MECALNKQNSPLLLNGKKMFFSYATRKGEKKKKTPTSLRLKIKYKQFNENTQGEDRGKNNGEAGRGKAMDFSHAQIAVRIGQSC